MCVYCYYVMIIFCYKVSKIFKHRWERLDVVELVSDVGSFISTPKHQENKDYRGWSLFLYLYSFVLVNLWEDKFMRNRIVVYIYIYIYAYVCWYSVIT